MFSLRNRKLQSLTSCLLNCSFPAEMTQFFSIFVLWLWKIRGSKSQSKANTSNVVRKFKKPNRMKIYKANRKGFINYLLIGSLILPIIVFFLDKNTFTEKPFIFLPLLIPLILIFWISNELSAITFCGYKKWRTS